MKKSNGITLIALVITIIILIILAAVTINLIINDDGIATKAAESADQYNEKADVEKFSLDYQEFNIERLTNKKYRNKNFLEYIDTKDNYFITNFLDDTNQKANVIFNGNKYLVDISDGKLNVSYVDVADENETLKPKFSNLSTTINNVSITVNAIVKGDNATTIVYSIKKDTDTAYGAEQTNSTFDSLEPNKTYNIAVKATNQYGSTIRYITVNLLKDKNLVTFSNSGSVYTVEEVQRGQSIALPTGLTKERYTLAGWSETDGGEVISEATYTPTEDVTLYAVWTRNYIVWNFGHISSGNGANTVSENNGTLSTSSSEYYGFKSSEPIVQPGETITINFDTPYSWRNAFLSDSPSVTSYTESGKDSSKTKFTLTNNSSTPKYVGIWGQKGFTATYTIQ